MRTLVLAGMVVIGVGGTVHAQPAPDGSDKLDAKALMQSGVKLLDAKDYLGALAIFKTAYQRFPSAKILLNIGTTLTLLDRKADAANAYQRYLDSPDADAARKNDVIAVLADLDKAVGRLEISVTPDDAEVMITDEWLPAKTVKLWRVTPGSFSLQARKQGFKGDGRTANIIAGEKSLVVIKLEPIVTTTTTTTGPTISTVERDDLMPIAPTIESPRSRFGGFAMVHVSVTPKIGSAWLVGGTADLTEQLSVDAALILGPGLVSDGMGTAIAPPKFGAFAGASFAFLTGQTRPRASFGVPVFFSDGARFSLRGAGGLEYVASRHWAIAVEIGAEYELNPQTDIRSVAFVPALGVSGRL